MNGLIQFGPTSRFDSFSKEELLYLLNVLLSTESYSPVREKLIDEIRTECNKKAQFMIAGSISNY